MFLSAPVTSLAPNPSWIPRDTPRGIPVSTTELYAAAYSPELNTVAAVGQTGTDRRVLTSQDGGFTWVRVNSGNDAVSWRSIVWAPGLGVFVAVCLPNPQGIMYSTDGLSWTSYIPTGFYPGQWQDICWSPQLGRLLACNPSGGGGGSGIMYSDDNANWTFVNVGFVNSWRSCAWSPSLGLFAVGGGGGTNPNMITSPTGAAGTWTSRGLVGGSITSVWAPMIWVDELGFFIAARSDGLGGSGQVATSTDGVNWTVTTVTGLSNSVSRIAYAPGYGFMAGAGGALYYSVDGFNWTLTANFGSGFSPRGLVWASGTNSFVAVSTNNSDQAVKTWTAFIET